ncbi:MAG: hypothetical protein HQL55_10695 [Magnetococcales bacterium]|nr:hypothetical protein [Magnetococcales bacterium]
MDTASPDERYGFRLNQGMVEMRQSGSSLDCQSGEWLALTTPAVVVDSLQFNLSNSLCLNYTQSGTDCVAAPPINNDVLLRNHRLEITLTGHLRQKAVLTQSDGLFLMVRNVVVERVP